MIPNGSKPVTRTGLAMFCLRNNTSMSICVATLTNDTDLVVIQDDDSEIEVVVPVEETDIDS